MNRDPEKWKDFIGLPPDAYCDMDPAKEKDMIALLLQHDTAPEPDFMAADRGFPSSWARVQKEDVEVFDDPDLRAYYPEFAIRDMQENRATAREISDAGDHRDAQLRVQKPCEIHRGSDRRRRPCGRRVGHPQTPPGLGVLQEMAVFQEDAHVPPMKVLQAATSWVAHHFRIKDIGSIEVGKLADIDIVDADPTRDILNMRKLDTVIKDGKIVDRSYHPWFAGWMFSNDREHEGFGPNITGLGWEAGLKAATFNRRPFFGLLPLAPPPQIPDPAVSPTPGIEETSVHTIIQGTSDTSVTVKGINFVKRSVAYAGETPMPTQVVSKTELRATIPADLLANAGKLHITIRNPEPLSDYDWGPKSNTANILVPFSFTTAWSHNRY